MPVYQYKIFKYILGASRKVLWDTFYVEATALEYVNQQEDKHLYFIEKWEGNKRICEVPIFNRE